MGQDEKGKEKTMPNPPNHVPDYEDMRGTPKLEKLATKIAIGWMRRLRARIGIDIEEWGASIGGDPAVPIDHEVAQQMLDDTIALIAEHVWEIPLFDFVKDKEIAAEHEPEYARLRHALETIEQYAVRRTKDHRDAVDLLLDIKVIAAKTLLGPTGKPKRL
jgi:hypothetical protein